MGGADGLALGASDATNGGGGSALSMDGSTPILSHTFTRRSSSRDEVPLKLFVERSRRGCVRAVGARSAGSDWIGTACTPELDAGWAFLDLDVRFLVRLMLSGAVSVTRPKWLSTLVRNGTVVAEEAFPTPLNEPRTCVLDVSERIRLSFSPRLVGPDPWLILYQAAVRAPKTMRPVPNSARVVRRKPNTPGPSALMIMWRLTHPQAKARDEL